MDTSLQDFISGLRRLGPTKACQTIIDLAPGFTFSITPKEDCNIHHPIFEGGAWLEDFIEFYEFCKEDFALENREPLHDERFIRAGDIINHLYWQVDAISTERRRTEINTHGSFLDDLAEGEPIHRRCFIEEGKEHADSQMKSPENGEQVQGVDSQGVTMITAMIARL